MAALRLAKAAEKMSPVRDDWMLKRVREAAEQVLAGLDEFSKATHGLRRVAGQ